MTKLTFRMVSGSSDLFTHELDRIDTILKALVAVKNTPAAKPLLIELMDSVVGIHDTLVKMTGVGSTIDHTNRVYAPVGEVIYNDWFPKELTFIRGAVIDPFLHSTDGSDEIAAFQQSAVLNLRKAQWLLSDRINRFMPVHV